MDACAALRLIGTNISPALGFFDTPAVNLATATPLAGAPPTPIPAGIYDAGIVYKPGSANLHCLNGSSISPSAFLVQVWACHQGAIHSSTTASKSLHSLGPIGCTRVSSFIVAAILNAS